jgi:NAD(P)-dependent dehydrogenase (short-subunit alcohol dehydrogenase family)
MPFVGNVTTIRDRNACYKDYDKVKESGMYFVSQNSFTAPSAHAYVQRLLREAPQAKEAVKGKLAVVTGVTMGGTGYHIALELAVQAGMHVFLLGKSESNLRKCVKTIHEEASRRGLDRPVLYQTKFHLASLASATRAADVCRNLVQSKSYGGKLHVLVNHAGIGSEAARLTDDGIEYNTGCNFVCTHYLTKSLIDLLQAAATNDYKPRVVMAASMGHAFGAKFDPIRLAQFPKEGGAPAGYIVVVDETTIKEHEPPPSEPNTTESRLAAVAKVGTQVGRSKMAVVADVLHFSKLYPEINFTSHHAGSIKSSQRLGMGFGPNLIYNYVAYPFRFSPSQGARAALRAALDPDMNTAEDLQGAYLHADGNPWAPMVPTTRDPLTQQPYEMDVYAEVCYEAADALLAELVTTKSSLHSKAVIHVGAARETQTPEAMAKAQAEVETIRNCRLLKFQDEEKGEAEGAVQSPDHALEVPEGCDITDQSLGESEEDPDDQIPGKDDANETAEASDTIAQSQEQLEVDVAPEVAVVAARQKQTPESAEAQVEVEKIRNCRLLKFQNEKGEEEDTVESPNHASEAVPVVVVVGTAHQKQTPELAKAQVEVEKIRNLRLLKFQKEEKGEVEGSQE